MASMKTCPDCGEGFWNSSGHQLRCSKCAYKRAKEITLAGYRKRKEKNEQAIN
jgi:DNA-directed RNA polymerase subunit M/transcription elongation factor TFIIS